LDTEKSIAEKTSHVNATVNAALGCGAILSLLRKKFPTHDVSKFLSSLREKQMQDYFTASRIGCSSFRFEMTHFIGKTLVSK